MRKLQERGAGGRRFKRGSDRAYLTSRYRPMLAVGPDRIDTLILDGLSVLLAVAFLIVMLSGPRAL